VLRSVTVVPDDRLLVGIPTGDDAGVFRLTEELALVQTVDFFTPIVDDPYLYGQIAAANSLSDVYAMAGEPLIAMNILCYPIGSRDPEELVQILKGGADKLAEAGVVLVGGHTTEDDEPKYGLAVTGVIHPERVVTNAGAQPGDAVVLTKPLGVGIIATAAKFDEAPAPVLDAACRTMATLNAGAARAMRRIGVGDEGIHAATDITGYGLLGHLFNIARESCRRIRVYSDRIPVLAGAEELAAGGNITRGDRENAQYIGECLEFAPGIAATRRNVMLDPQTSGGLAIVVGPHRLDDLLTALAEEGVDTRAVIGEVMPGEPGIEVV